MLEAAYGHAAAGGATRCGSAGHIRSVGVGCRSRYKKTMCRCFQYAAADAPAGAYLGSAGEDALTN
jgi:hypothetical protein